MNDGMVFSYCRALSKTNNAFEMAIDLYPIVFISLLGISATHPPAPAMVGSEILGFKPRAEPDPPSRPSSNAKGSAVCVSVQMYWLWRLGTRGRFLAEPANLSPTNRDVQLHTKASNFFGLELPFRATRGQDYKNSPHVPLKRNPTVP